MGQARDAKFSTNIFNEMLLNAANCQGYSFYRWEGRGVKITLPTQIRVKHAHNSFKDMYL